MKTYLGLLRWLIYYLLFFTFYCSCRPVNPQNNSTDQDSLFAQIRHLLSRYQWKNAIVLNENYIKDAYKKHHQNGVVLGYINIGNIYYLHNNYQEALSFLNKAKTEKEGLNDPELDTRLYTEYGGVYSSLNLKAVAGEYYAKAFQSSEKILNPKRKESALWYLSGSKIGYYEDNKQYDSMFLYLRNDFMAKPEPLVTAKIAKYFIHNNVNLDSARIYLQKADSIYTHDSSDYSPYYKGLILRFYGDMYTAKEEYDKAIPYYLNALDIFKKEHRVANLKTCYNLLYLSYKEKGIRDTSNAYLEKYTSLSDSIASATEAPLGISVKNIEDEYALQYSNSKQKNLLIILCLAISSVIIALLMFKRIKNKERKTSELLVQREEEKLILQQKVNDSFNELIELARQSDPNFYTRFKEVYQEWHKKIIEIAPDITLTELALCAYIYLDFQTKEIAELTFKSIRTIQNGKYSIRKKLKIDSDVDIYIWLKNLNN